MVHSDTPCRFHWRLLPVLLAVMVLCASYVRAQEPACGGRIVERRPPLYTFKRDINPLTWVEWGAEPLFRSAESGWIRRIATYRRPSDGTAGVKFGLGGTGSGSGFGPAVTFFHKDLLGRGIELKVPLTYTYLRYEQYQAIARVPVIQDSFFRKLTFDVQTAYRSHAGDDMFTLGNDAPRRLESQVRTVSREVGAGFSTQLNEWWTSGLHETYRNVGVTTPVFGVSAQDRLKAFAIPGLASGGIIRSTVLTIDHNTQDRQHPLAKGGEEHAEISLNESIGKGDFSYWRYHLDFQHFFPITDDYRTVVAFRGFAETNQAKSGSSVPWFDMPALGTWDTLRGFENFRFRDRSALSLTAEYRYRIWRAMDWGFFLDGGQVAPHLGDMGLNRFHIGYGFRFFVLPKATFPIAIDVAHSAEKWWRLYINFNTSF